MGTSTRTPPSPSPTYSHTHTRMPPAHVHSSVGTHSINRTKHTPPSTPPHLLICSSTGEEVSCRAEADPQGGPFMTVEGVEQLTLTQVPHLADRSAPDRSARDRSAASRDGVTVSLTPPAANTNYQGSCLTNCCAANSVTEQMSRSRGEVGSGAKQTGQCCEGQAAASCVYL
jgi:hypothetical protein